jgi:hypothetical protein
VRYAVQTNPIRVVICHCKFCQRATGTAYLVEPIFKEGDFEVTSGEPQVYAQVSEGSGKKVFIHFCPDCGTKVFLTFERMTGIVGVYGGTFDDPDWFDISPENARHIFTGSAQRGTVIPPHLKTFEGNAMSYEGVPNEPTVFHEPCVIGQSTQQN